MRNKEADMGEYRIGTGKDVLVSLGIGSCVAVGLIDEKNSRCGIAHVMLPADEDEESEKRADVLIDEMVEEMKYRGSRVDDMEAKIFGGSSMFNNSFNIGEENVESVKEELKKRGIDIKKEDTGGEKGRAVWLNCRSGNAVVRRSFEGTTTEEIE